MFGLRFLSMRNRRSIPLRLALVLVVAGILLGMVVPRLFASEASSEPQKFHVVRGGENLWGLASRFAPDEDPRRYVYDVVQVNGLESVDVTPGQKLILPSD